MSEFGFLFETSTKAVFEVFIIVATGTLIAKKGYFSMEQQRFFSQLTFVVLLPCLLFQKIASSLSVQKLAFLWLLIVASLFYIFIGACFAFAMERWMNVPEKMAGPFVVATSIGNQVFIPLSVVIAVSGVGQPFTEEEGSLGVAYISIFIIGATLGLWGWGYTFIGNRMKKIKEREQREAVEEGTAEQQDDGGEMDGENESSSPTLDLIKMLLKKPPVIALILGLILGVIEPVQKLFFLPGGYFFFIGRAIETIGDAAVPASLMILGGNLAEIDVNFPAWMKCGTNGKVEPDVKKEDREEESGAAEMSEEEQEAQDEQDMTSLTIVDPRGSSLTKRNKGKSGNDENEEAGQSQEDELGPEMPLTWYTVAAVFVVRFLILPLVGWGTVLLIRMLPFVDKSDRMFAFVLLVESSAPTAMNTIILCQLHRTSEREIARLMMYEYVGSVILLSIWVFVWLAVVNSF